MFPTPLKRDCRKYIDLIKSHKMALLGPAQKHPHEHRVASALSLF